MPQSLLSATDPGGAYIDWGVIHISATNLAVIGVMLVLFILAVVIPFPRDHTKDSQGPR